MNFKHLGLSLLLTASLAAPALAKTSTLAEGTQLFLTNCSSCHLASGKGGVRFGDVQSADLRAPALEQTYKHSDALLLRAILDAKDEDGAPLDHPMPAWKGKLTTAQATDIIAYLKTLHS
jgi:mono/diheme cytochrome c family protein